MSAFKLQIINNKC